MPTTRIDVTAQTPANSASAGPSSGYDWWGPITDSFSNHYVVVTRSANGNVYAGWSKGPETVEGNRVLIDTDGKMKGIWGGYSASGDAKGNIVEIKGTTSNSDMPTIRGGQALNGTADRNWIYLHNGATVYADMSAGYGNDTGTAHDNVVVIEAGATVGTERSTRTVNGGLGTSADGNALYVAGTVYGAVNGGNATSQSGTANGNLVYLQPGATVSGNAFAASSIAGAQNNVLVVEDATVEGNAAAVGGNGYTGIGSNELHLIGKPVVKGGAGANYDGWQANQYRSVPGLVHVNGTATVGSLEGFDSLIFELTDENVTTAALTITNEHVVVYGQEPLLDLRSVEVGIDALALSDPSQGAVLIGLTEGQSLDLKLDAHTSFNDDSRVFVQTTWTVSSKVVQTGSITVDKVGINAQGDIVASLNGTETVLAASANASTAATTESHTLAESWLGTVAFVNQGAEFIADEGMRAMAAAALPGQTAVFGAMHGGSSRYRTGSHVDVDGVTLVTGAVTRTGALLLAAFAEAGWAQSEGHVAAFRGDGDHDYYGLGAALRYTFDNPFYADASVRLGRASTDFTGRYTQASAHYEADGLYGTLHAGVGYILPLTRALDLDLFGRYVLTYLEGDTTDLGTGVGETYETDDTVTHALRFGARLTGAAGDAAHWRAGLAYERVFDGDAESTVIAAGTRSALTVPTLEGDTGIAEVGLTVKPTQTRRWFADVSLKGYAGERKGVAGNATIGYTF